MFKLERPNMAVNDPRVSVKKGGKAFTRRYQMWNTWNIKKNEGRQHIIEWVAKVARDAPGGKLKNLVLSGHGLPGYLQVGQGFNKSHLQLFKKWRGLVEKLWLPNCLVAQIPTKAGQKKYDKDFPGWGVSDGNLFCSALAKNINGYVVASTEIQREVFKTIHVDMMTSFEGLILSYSPKGKITWSSRNPSTYVPD